MCFTSFDKGIQLIRHLNRMKCRTIYFVAEYEIFIYGILDIIFFSYSLYLGKNSLCFLNYSINFIIN